MPASDDEKNAPQPAQSITGDNADTALLNQLLGVLEDRKALDVTVLDVSELSSFTDFMVLASGTSNRHVSALVEYVIQEAKDAGSPPLGVEGRETNEWVLVDCGDVIVHVMQKEARAFYDLERLWCDLPADDGEQLTD